MGSYKLYDTGYANTSASGTQNTRAASGSAVTINVESISYNSSANIDAQENPGTYENSETNYMSVRNPVYTINVRLNRKDSGYETLLVNLNDMRTTKGLKLFYYDNTGDTSSVYTVTQAYGSTSYGSLAAPTNDKAILGRVVSFTFNEVSNRDLLSGTIVFQVSNPRSV